MATQTETRLEQPEAIELSSSPPQDNDGSSQPPDHDARLRRATYLRIASASFSFFVAGVNDGSLGAIIPYVIRQYAITTAIVSSVYGATFAGWAFAALTNTHLCQYLDTGSMLLLGAVCQVVAHVLRSWMPPFGLFVVTFFLVAVGQAYNDTHANTFVAGVKGAHRWLAVIHASYMGGCLLGPFVSTAVASAGDKPTWHLFYTFPVAIGVVNIGLILWAFRDTVVIKRKQPQDTMTQGDDHGPASRNKDALQLIRTTLTTPAVWLLSLFYFFYIGSQLTANGWVVEYLVQVRGGDLSSMGYVPAGFNGGCLLGRLLLAEPTYRLGEKRMVLVYCGFAIGLQLVFWLVPNIIAASVAISFIGFFTGPLFATGISLGSKLFSHEIHSTALVFVFVCAQLGGSAFPIITGIIASSLGVGTLQPILVALLAGTAISWILVPRPKSLDNSSLHQE